MALVVVLVVSEVVVVVADVTKAINMKNESATTRNQKVFQKNLVPICHQRPGTSSGCIENVIGSTCAVLFLSST